LSPVKGKACAELGHGRDACVVEQAMLLPFVLSLAVPLALALFGMVMLWAAPFVLVPTS